MGRERKQRKAAIEGETPSVSIDIIYSILWRLPAKSLLRFRCVCKSWRGVISEPHFIKTQLNQAIKLDRQRLFWRTTSIPSSFYSVGYEILDDSKERLYLPLIDMQPIIYCSYNGLVLLGLPLDKMCVLWNPSTRAHIKLSCPFNFAFCGLCYDSSIDDYKVVLISRPSDDGGEILYVVFSFKGKSWTEPRKFSYFFDYSETSAIVNGVFYSTVLISYEAPTKTYGVVFFDEVNEEFKEVRPLPNCIYRWEVFRLMDVRGCLGLYCRTHNRFAAVELWVMEEHGDQMNFWTMLITFPSYQGETKYLDYFSTKLLCVTEKGEVVMVINGKNVVVYNPEENKYRTVETIVLRPADMVVSFVDSLVLPTLD